MFGYVTVNEDDLKVRELRRYRGFYCGLCRSLKKRHGIRGQAVLPYDMVFVDLLLNGLYEMPLTEESRVCMAHPTKKQHMLYNEITDYCADMGLMLAYYKMLDDASDDKKTVRAIGAKMLEKRVGRVKEAWPRQSAAVEDCISRLSQCEKSGGSGIDEIAGLTGRMLGEILVMEEDAWSDILRRLGFDLGKFVYLMDAYEDLEKDRKKGSFNPWETLADRKDFDALAENALMILMGDASREFEKLPIIEDAEILRNIMYSGVWKKYRTLKEKKAEEEKEEGKDDHRSV
ncbi:MAG: DUF5685 family protein [Lachnospiraceae bacterium]|nr:DUF5685 family protein [Lachnospiraceae bacterium]